MGAGGAEKTISLLLPELIKDYRVNLILFHDVRYFEIPSEVNVLVLSQKKSNSLFDKLLSPFILPFKFKKILKQTQPIVSISFLTRPNLLNTLFKKKKIKVIISERCFPSIAYKSNRWRYRLYKALFPKLYNKADVLFSNSMHINRDLKDNFGLRIPTRVIYNPIEIPADNFNSDLAQKDIDLVWVGKLYAIKNPMLLVKALRICHGNPQAYILGDGVLLEDTKSQSTDLKIRFEGKVNNVFDYLKRTKILVLTSNSEGFPNVILEGMAYGLPIISTNCQSGPLELLNDNEPVEILQGEYLIAKYGILINVGDEIALAKAIDLLLTDHKLYDQLSQASTQRSKDYSVQEIYQNLKVLIQENERHVI